MNLSIAEPHDPKQEVRVHISVSTVINVFQKGITRIQECIAHIMLPHNKPNTFTGFGPNKQELINTENWETTSYQANTFMKHPVHLWHFSPDFQERPV